MDTEDQILRGTKLIAKSKIKNLEKKLDSQKYKKKCRTKLITKF